MTPQFAIGEWLVCPRCEVICDTPFRPVGSAAVEPELVLGWSLPAQAPVPTDRWQIEVEARCPRCEHRIVGIATFDERLLAEFSAASNATT